MEVAVPAPAAASALKQQQPPTRVVEMKLVDNVIRSMRVGKVFKENQDPVNHLHFSADGASLITSAEDDQGWGNSIDLLKTSQNLSQVMLEVLRLVYKCCAQVVSELAPELALDLDPKF